nr:ABC transporter permease [uncultured Blautia sp.]
MRQVFTVFAYTFKEGIRKKAFWVSTGIIMALIVLLCFAPRIITAFEAQESAKKNQAAGEIQKEAGKEGICYFIDETGVFEKNLAAFQAVYPDLLFQVADVSELETLKEDVAENEKHSIFYVEDQEGIPFFHVINTNFMKGINTELMVETGTAVWQSAFLIGQGLSKETIAASQTPLGYAEEAAGTMSLTGYVLGLVMTFVMFFAVYYYGYGVAMSVASEKTSRVMETLIISAKPSRILIGKCLAMGAVGLLQLVGLLGFGLGCYSILMPDGFRIHGIEISLSGFGAETILVLVLYFILGYALYAVLNSVCGAAVSKVEDLNSAMMPVSIVVVIGFYLGYFTSVAGGGSNALSKLALYLPISSPFAVPFKILTGDIATQELLISMGILAAAIVVVAALSARIYSASVMHYGNPLKWKDLRKMKTN